MEARMLFTQDRHRIMKHLLADLNASFVLDITLLFNVFAVSVVCEAIARQDMLLGCILS